MRLNTEFTLRLIIVLVLMGTMLAVSGCTSRSDSLPTPPAEEQSEVQVTPVEPTPTGLDDDQVEDQQAERAQEPETNQCLICHTDEQALRDTADPEPVVEEESSGEG